MPFSMNKSRSSVEPFLMKTKTDILTAIGDTGKPVDWWFAYKVSAHSEPANVSKGNDYLYYDAAAAKARRPLKLSASKMDQKQGALFHTLQQLYSATPGKNPGLGWLSYNDENPNDKSGYKNPANNARLKPGQTFSSRGHTKGVLAFDLKSDSGFWLVHSTPKFILPGQFVFPDTGMEMAQTFLCVTLPDAATALKLAQQMYTCQQPNVYAASPLPKLLKGKAQDFRTLLMKDKVAPEPKSDSLKRVVLPFTSRGGQKFQAIAKNKGWGQDQKPKLDFYNDLVAPTLGANLDVETWEHDPTPKPTDKFSPHKVVAMKSVNLGKLGSKISWSEENDHGKLAISAPSEKAHWVCVGDINFTLAQEKRGGGTVAFVCNPLWKQLNAILSTAAETGAKTPSASKK